MTMNDTSPGGDAEADEQYVHEILTSAMTDARPPTDLAATSQLLGRRQRTRRRIGMVGGAVAATTVLALAAPSFLGGESSVVVDPAGPAVGASEPPVEPEILAQPAPKGWWDMPATEMLEVLEDTLPEGVSVSSPGPVTADTPEGGPAQGWIRPNLAFPEGAGALNVILTPNPPDSVTLVPEPGPDGEMTGVPTAGSATRDVCVSPTPADGGSDSDAGECTELSDEDFIVVEAEGTTDISCDAEWTGTTDCVQLYDEAGEVIGRRLVNITDGIIHHEVVLRRQGGTVYAASANTTDDKWGEGSPATAERPPLSLDQLEELVRDDVWTSYTP